MLGQLLSRLISALPITRSRSRKRCASHPAAPFSTESPHSATLCRRQEPFLVPHSNLAEQSFGKAERRRRRETPRLKIKTTRLTSTAADAFAAVDGRMRTNNLIRASPMISDAIQIRLAWHCAKTVKRTDDIAPQATAYWNSPVHFRSISYSQY